MRNVLLSVILILSGYVFGLTPQGVNDETSKFKLFSSSFNNQDKIFLQDSVHVYNSSGKLKARELNYFNDDHMESHSFVYNIDYTGQEKCMALDSFFYDKDYNVILYKMYKLIDGEWQFSEKTHYFWNALGKKDSIVQMQFDPILAEWILKRKEVYIYNAEGSLIEEIYYVWQEKAQIVAPDMKCVYSEFIEIDKPKKETSWLYQSETWNHYMNIYNQYDAKIRLISKVRKSIMSGEETNSSKVEWTYNNDNQMMEETKYTVDYSTKEFRKSTLTKNIYHPQNHYLVTDSSFNYNTSSNTWRFMTKFKYFWREVIYSSIAPLASVGSYWNYWMAQERAYGFNQYSVVKDTIITAPMYETGELKTVKASWIEKTASFLIHNQAQGVEKLYIGAFAAYRDGNCSYIWEPRTKKWFKWIDMNAKPGDKWVVPEFITGRGLYDYVEVSLLTTMVIDGKEVPMIYLIPSCSSRYTTKKDFTSRLKMSGYYNIDYWTTQGNVEPLPNGFVYTGELKEINAGLLCAKVNDTYLVTDKLQEYVRSNNKPYFEQGIVDCDSLKAPILMPDESMRNIVKAKNLRPIPDENHVVFDFTTNVPPIAALEKQNDRIKECALTSDVPELLPTDTIRIPVVVHVVHNPETPEEKIELSQVHKMINGLNDAYSVIHIAQVRDLFKPVVSNPYIKFELAKKDPLGSATTGLIYYETNEEYFKLPSTSDIQIRYAFKYNNDNTPRNWDHTKYANIYVVDLGGFDQVKNVGGFVTNPEPKNMKEFEELKNWIMEGNTSFWNNWLKSQEGSQLDGLTVDTWYTFGGKSELNPLSTLSVAIHELGHYLGLKHVSLQVIQNSDGSILTNDDGFEDTPYTHYNQYALVSCDQDIYQCGNLVQTENYMDYSLECACMFTKEQSTFMRKFTSLVRPYFVNSSTNIEIPISQPIRIYPNPAKEHFIIEGEFISGKMYDVTGRFIRNIFSDKREVSVVNMKTGLYFLQLKREGGKISICKIMIAN